jgi:hypothetical protein
MGRYGTFASGRGAGVYPAVGRQRAAGLSSGEMGSEFGDASCAHGLVESGASGGLDSDVRSTLRWGEGGEGLGHEMASIFVMIKVPGGEE